MRCAIPITTNLFCNMGEHRLLWWNCKISPKINTAFVAYDMLFLEKSSGTHFCQFRFPKVRPVVVQLWKKLAWLQVWKAKFSRFYICHDICIGTHLCHDHHRTLMVWLCDLVDTDFIRALQPNMRCAIPIKVNSFHNNGGPRHLWRNFIISPKQMILYCLW
jgi:hypothetical protein